MELKTDGCTNEETDERTNKRTNGQMNGGTDKRIKGWTTGQKCVPMLTYGMEVVHLTDGNKKKAR